MMVSMAGAAEAESIPSSTHQVDGASSSDEDGDSRVKQGRELLKNEDTRAQLLAFLRGGKNKGKAKKKKTKRPPDELMSFGLITQEETPLTATALDDAAISEEVEDPEALKRRKRFEALARIFNVQVSMDDSSAFNLVSYIEEELDIRVTLKQRKHGTVMSKDYDAALETGVDNTGHVRVWAPEEIMSYFFAKYTDIFTGKSVCEFGCGLALASFVIATCTDATRVVATDGNPDVVQAVLDNREFNTDRGGMDRLTAEVLVWSKGLEEQGEEKFDIIVCCECLYFEHLHTELLDTTARRLQTGGTAYFFAPHRRGTADAFIKKAEVLFQVKVYDDYDQSVLELAEKHSLDEFGPYERDLHYPLMITLTHVLE